MNRKDIKIVGVIDDEPFHFKAWSGSSYYFFTALKTNGFLHQAISAQPSQWTNYLHKFFSFHPDIAKWKFKFHIDVDYYAQMTKAAESKLKALNDNDYNVILQVGAWYDLTKRKNKMTVSYHDGNLHALLKSPYGYPLIKNRYIKRALDYETTLYEKMDRIFPMSRWLADSFIQDFGVRADKVVPVGAGINLPYIKEVANKSYDSPKILFVGKNFERKGGRQLLQAFEIVRKEVKDATLTIIGPTLDQLPDGVTCHRFVSKYTKEGIDFLLSEYSSASIFVMPSLYEPFGIVFAEAMAHKLPCIGTNICAMPEIIDDRITGYVVPPNNSQVLAKRMIELLKDHKLCREMGEKGYLKYQNHYTWDIVTMRIVEGIQDIV